MDRRDIARSRRAAGADRPDRFIGDDQIVDTVGQRSGQLAADARLRLPGIAFRPGFANADDDRQSGGTGGDGFGAHIGIGLAIVGAALAMADDDEAGAAIDEHVGRDAAGMGA